MDTTEFVYVTYINATPETVWGALLDNDMIKQYWGVTKTYLTGRLVPQNDGVGVPGSSRRDSLQEEWCIDDEIRIEERY